MIEDKQIIGSIEYVLVPARRRDATLHDIIFTKEEVVFVNILKVGYMSFFGSMYCAVLAFLITIVIISDITVLNRYLIVLASFLLFSFLFIVLSKRIIKKKRSEIAKMGISEIINIGSFKLTKEELRNIEVRKKFYAVILFRSGSCIFIKKGGYQKIINFRKRADFDMFLSLVERVKTG